MVSNSDQPVLAVGVINGTISMPHELILGSREKTFGTGRSVLAEDIGRGLFEFWSKPHGPINEPRVEGILENSFDALDELLNPVRAPCFGHASQHGLEVITGQVIHQSALTEGRYDPVRRPVVVGEGFNPQLPGINLPLFRGQELVAQLRKPHSSSGQPVEVPLRRDHWLAVQQNCFNAPASVNLLNGISRGAAFDRVDVACDVHRLHFYFLSAVNSQSCTCSTTLISRSSLGPVSSYADNISCAAWPISARQASRSPVCRATVAKVCLKP